MGLYVKYKFPDMYTSVELNEATQKLVTNAQKNNVILGIFLFGTARVKEFEGKGFTLIAVGNDLHHIHTQVRFVTSVLGQVKSPKVRQVGSGLVNSDQVMSDLVMSGQIGAV